MCAVQLFQPAIDLTLVSTIAKAVLGDEWKPDSRMARDVSEIASHTGFELGKLQLCPLSSLEILRVMLTTSDV